MTMPDLTVFMPAFDSRDDMEKGIRSVLNQKGVNFELLITGHDDAAEIVQTIGDERIRFYPEKYRAPDRSYNAALERSNSGFFATMDPQVTLLPRALEKMFREFEKGPDLGIVHSYFFQLDEKGHISRDQFRMQRHSLVKTMGPDSNYRKELRIQGATAAGYFRIYRADLLRSLGNFRVTNRVSPDYEMYLRVTSQGFRIHAVPEHLYTHRVDPAKQGGNITARNWTRTTILNAKSLGNLIQLHLRRIGKSLLASFYYKILLQLPARPIPLTQSVNRSTINRRIAYYIWHFPVLSQTFVNRELTALMNSGLSILIVADEPEDPVLADDNAKALLKHTRYLLPVDNKELRKYKRFFFFRNPFRYVNLFLFVITHRFGPFKNLSRDRKVFDRAVHLAGVLNKENITHLHSPWNDRCAFLSLLASKFLGISYSVQSRAHEVHRKSYLYGLRENLENASFAITNSQYNRSYLQSLVGEEARDRIVKIYNGIDLNGFVPACSKETRPQILQVLSVARLIEQKGLIYLLHACKILKDRGIPFQCEIIGGPEEQLFINYALELRKLHRRLDLSDTVIFGGTLPFERVLEKYKSAHLFVMPSVIGEDGSRDITPNALIEAMAMKLPVISTTVTAIPEMVEHGISGLLVPPNDEIALADAMVKLMENPALRKDLAENARRKVEDSFDITKNVRQYIQLFLSNGKMG
jgi:colanic acid/amylovoran biosynthesis glycosyltransferase